MTGVLLALICLFAGAIGSGIGCYVALWFYYSRLRSLGLISRDNPFRRELDDAVIRAA